MSKRIQKLLPFFLAAFCFFAAAPVAQALHPYSAYYKGISQVIDYAHVLTPAVQKDLTELADDTEYFTGRQMVVVIVPSLKGWKPEYYAQFVAQSMGVGVGKPGVLLLIAKQEIEARISIGPGLERVLTPDILNSIINDEINAELYRGDFQQAVRKGTIAISDAMQGKYVPGGKKWKQYLPFIILCPLVILLQIIFGDGRGARIFGGAWGRW